MGGECQESSTDSMIFNVEIRQEVPSDYPEIARVHTLAFGRDNEAKLVDRLRDSDRYFPELSLVAETKGMIVGHILLSEVDLVGNTTRRVLALAPLAVLPQWQNQGIGSALVETSLKIAECRSAVFVIVLGHPQFYPKFGFEPAIRYGIKCSFSVPEAVFMAKPLPARSEVDRGMIVYPKTFEGV
jgi:putative acetyltransferase